MGKPEVVGQGCVVPMLRSSRYCEQEYNLSPSVPLIAYYHSLPSAPCICPVPRRDNPKFLSIYETRPKVQDLVILSTSGLDGVHFDTETCKLNNNLFSPYTPNIQWWNKNRITSANISTWKGKKRRHTTIPEPPRSSDSTGELWWEPPDLGTGPLAGVTPDLGQAWSVG